MNGLGHLPKVYDIDDYRLGSQVYNFIVIDYIEGENIKNILRKNSITDVEAVGIGIVILNIMKELYGRGYLYGDLKLENILIDNKLNKIMLIDFGGIIKKDKTIKEYTPSYNTLSWGIETDRNRELEIIFGISMLLTSILLRKEFNPLKHTINYVIYSIKKSHMYSKLKNTIIYGLKLKYKTLDSFNAQLVRIISELKNSNSINTVSLNKAVDVILVISICFSIFVLALWIKGY